MIETIKQLADKHWKEVVEIRRDLHAHPELAFQEIRTANQVKKVLKKYNIPFEDEIAQTGIVATIQGENPSKKCIALRADLDALPILEQNKVEYASKIDGIMHACGHDVHTSSLLGTAIILQTLKDKWEGTVKLFFQPSEEKMPGGAKVMIDEGVLKQQPIPQSIYGQHVHPPMEVGKVGFAAGGIYMASADEIYFTVKGKGGHAALPHTLTDTVLVTSHIIVALQQLVSRNCPPTIPCVLSFGKIEAKGATNIIPMEVKVAGTFRTMNEEWRDKAHIIMTKLATQLAESMGATCDFEVLKGYPVLVNEPELTQRSKAWAIEYMGVENVEHLDLRMSAEDFAYFSQKMPACFYRIGTGNKAKGITSPVHTPTFDIDEKALQISIGLMSYLAIKELEFVN